MSFKTSQINLKIAIASQFFPSNKNMNLTIEIEPENDGRWIAELINLPGVLVYGNTQEQALKKVKILALLVLADLLENGELNCEFINFNLNRN